MPGDKSLLEPENGRKCGGTDVLTVHSENPKLFIIHRVKYEYFKTNKLFILHVYVCNECMYLHQMYAIPTEVRKGSDAL